MVQLVEDLLRAPRQRIVIVDDGSGPEYADVFQRVAADPRVCLLRHATNLGKGQALKTGFNHVLLDAWSPGVVTADADGQHLADDIRRVAEALLAAPDELVLGGRRLDANVPWRSAFGNSLTRYVFRGFVGRPLHDTQSGLRGIPRSLLADLLHLRASGYEFELEMLVLAANRGIRLNEVTIATVYEEGNRSSHFNPLRDSLKIYFVFLRFLALSLATAGLDFLVFWLAYSVTSNILLSTALARVVAGAFNFTLARTVVFRSRGAARSEVIRYVALVLWLMALSYGLLTGLVIVLGLSVYLAKMIAECTLFVASFALQRLLVFGQSRRRERTGAATDWDAYYRQPARPATITRRITGRLLTRLMKKHASAPVRTLCELGGANSCFYERLRTAFPDAAYVVADNNTYGLQLLRERARADTALSAHMVDLYHPPVGLPAGDVVFSVGLIEHFNPEGTARVIRAHFDVTRPGGVVIITFPTPTWLYRATRFLAEMVGVWRFPDERPLTFAEVEAEVARHGAVLETLVNWPIILTQGIVVTRRLP